MRLRVAILLVLTLLTLAYRGTALYMRYFSPDLQTRSYFSGRYVGGEHVVVVHVDESLLGSVAPEQRLRTGDRILEIYDHRGEGGAVHGLFDYGALLRPIGGEPWRMVVGRPSGAGAGGGTPLERIELAMPPAVPVKWSVAEWATLLGMDLFLPCLALAVGVLVGFLRPRDQLAFLAALMFIAFSMWFRQPVMQFPAGLREPAFVVSVVAMYLSPYLFLHFFLLFPRRVGFDRRLPWLRPAAFTLTLAFCAVHLVSEGAVMLSFELASRLQASLEPFGLEQRWIEYGWIGFAGGMMSLSMAVLLATALGARVVADRRRSRIIASGAAFGLLPLLVTAALPVAGLKPSYAIQACAILLAGLFPASFAYAVIVHQVFGIRLILRRGLQYALVSKSFLAVEGVVLFAALFYVTHPAIERVLPDGQTSMAAVGVGLVTVGLLAGTQRINRAFFPILDRRFFRDAYDARKLLTQLSHAVRNLASRPSLLLERVADEILGALHPSRVAVFLREDLCPRAGPAGSEECATLFWSGRVGASGPPERMACCLNRGAPVATAAGQGAESRWLAARRPLARHLTECARAGAAEPLDVVPLGAAVSWDASHAGAQAEAEESLLLQRLNARLVIPLTTQGSALGFIVLGEKLSEEPYTAEDRELLRTVAEQSAVALDYSTLVEHVAEHERLEREVQIAGEVQERLLPAIGPRIAGVRYAAACHPAGEVGGDFYDFVSLGPDRLGLSIGDVAGKGISASLLMASLQALVRSHAATLADRPAELAHHVNHHLCATTDAARFATFFFATLDARARMLRYVNAGHVPPLLVRRSPGRGRTAPAVTRLATSGLPLGLFEDPSWSSAEVPLEPGDRLLMFSDGVTEAGARDGGEPFGERHLIEAVAALDPALDEAEQLRRLLASVNRFAGRGALHDDVTLLLARIV